jgi:hypothetical protein
VQPLGPQRSVHFYVMLPKRHPASYRRALETIGKDRGWLHLVCMYTPLGDRMSIWCVTKRPAVVDLFIRRRGVGTLMQSSPCNHMHLKHCLILEVECVAALAAEMHIVRGSDSLRLGILAEFEVPDLAPEEDEAWSLAPGWQVVSGGRIRYL